MKVMIDELEVLWPYPYIYPEQYVYMSRIKQTLDASPGGQCVLEMPTGTGKTVSLLSIITSYKYAHPEVGKLVYCTRTVQEMDKVVEELRRVIAFRMKVLAEEAEQRAAAANAAAKAGRPHIATTDISNIHKMDESSNAAAAAAATGAGAAGSTIGMSPLHHPAVMLAAAHAAKTKERVDRMRSKKFGANNKSAADEKKKTGPSGGEDFDIKGINPTQRKSNGNGSGSGGGHHHNSTPAVVESADAPRPAGQILGVCLSSRRNLCVHSVVSKLDNRTKVDALCRNLTAATYAKQLAQNEKRSKKHRRGADSSADTAMSDADTKSDDDEPTSAHTSTAAGAAAGFANGETCQYFEGYQRDGSSATLSGVYSLDDLKEYGLGKGWCPYFFARHLIMLADVVVFNYQYMLDPKIAGMVSKDIEPEAIIVFDEAHNIDNICIEALSVTVNKTTVTAAAANIKKLDSAIKHMELHNSARLEQEYQSLIRGLAASGTMNAEATEAILASPLLPPEMMNESMPGNIRKAKHFIMFLKTIIEYMKTRLKGINVTQEQPQTFMAHLQQETKMQETRACRFAYDRLSSLLKTLNVTDLDEFTPLGLVTNFTTLVSTYAEGFSVIMEPYDDRTPNAPDPRMLLTCLDASLAIKPVFDKFRSVVITSGTLSPMDFYPKMLRFQPKIVESLPMSLTRNCICPLIVSKGDDQLAVTSKYDTRSDLSVVSNYGKLLVSLSQITPDGIVVFFPSYRFMEDIMALWNKNGVLQSILSHKLIFIETKDIVETTLALDSYKKACDKGRGAIFFSVARGKVAEGIDFDRHYGRLVVLMGIPFQYTLSRVLRARLTFLRDTFNIPEADFLTFDALRQASQCVGRVIRSKTDYGIMIFADARYSRSDKRSKLPRWITQYLEHAHINLSTDRAVTIARDFLKKMAQPRSKTDELGVTMLDEKALAKRFGPETLAPTAIGTAAAGATHAPMQITTTAGSGGSGSGGGGFATIADTGARGPSANLIVTPAPALSSSAAAAAPLIKPSGAPAPAQSGVARSKPTSANAMVLDG